MKYFNLTLFCIVLLMSNTALRADYSPIPLNYMVLEADLAVYGVIENTDSSYFILKIKKEAFGDYNGATIKVNKFKDWRCAGRWATYEVGQAVFLFLIKNKDNEWCIMSGGGEGEMPVVDNRIYLSSYYSYGMPFVNFNRIDTNGVSHKYKYQVFEIYGSRYSGIRFDLDEFIDAVSGLKACFLLKKTKYRLDDKIKLLCSAEKLTGYQGKSELHNWFAEKCIK